MAEISEETRNKILDLLITGLSMREVCRMEGMPARSAVHRDLANDPEFQDRYARACEMRADVLFDEILEIADDGSNDWMERNYGDGDTETVLNSDHVQRSRLRLDARKWALSKMNPKKYGDKLDVNHAGGITVILSKSDGDL